MSGMWDEHAQAVCNLLQAWLDFSEKKSKPDKDGVDDYRTNFVTLSISSLRKELAAIGKAKGDTAQLYFPGYMSMFPVVVEAGEPDLYPLISIGVRKLNDELDIALRIATYFSDQGSLSAHGWRMELPDKGVSGGTRFHHFAHVQRIRAWQPFDKSDDSIGFHVDYMRDTVNRPGLNAQTVNERRPAFPLPCATAPGLVVCAMAALYGAEVTEDVLGNYLPKPEWLLDEIRKSMTFPFS